MSQGWVWLASIEIFQPLSELLFCKKIVFLL